MANPAHLLPIPVVLTIAGSDSGGGAGIQADLKTFMAMGVFGTSAVTCITAQNPAAVTGLEPLPARLVRAQIRAVRTGFPVAAAKTGMLYSETLIRTVARAMAPLRPFPLVVDPVMISTSGTRLLRRDAVEALCRELLPRATVITPNLDEAAALTGRPIRSLPALMAAARELSHRYGTACLVKGGHLGGAVVTDVLCIQDELTLYKSPRVRMAATHGTGCTFSAALAAALARGTALHEAVAIAKQFVTEALRQARPAGVHHPLAFDWVAPA